MSKKTALTTTLLLGAALYSGLSQAAPADAVHDLQQQWAQIKYQTPADKREAAFKTLSAKASRYEQTYSNSADVKIWDAIVLSTYAGEKGGLGALSLVTDAKKLLEESISEDPNALDGSAYTSLGSLYYQVPGWPIGFGSDKKAEKMLKQALTINPNGIDANYFYGDFLLQKGRKAEAKAAFQKALAAPARPGRELADSGRRQEIQDKLKKIDG